MEQSFEHRTGRVLLLGDNDLASLAIVRSLGRAGLSVHVGSFERTGITRRSRYVARVHDFGHPLTDGEGFAARVLDRLQREQFDLVIPASDKALVALMPYRDEVEKHCRFAAPDDHGFRATNYKAETVELARRAGFCVPKTFVVDRIGLPALSQLHEFPLVLKPVSSVLHNSNERNVVRIVRSHDEMVQYLPEMVGRCPVLIQEFHGGRGAGVGVLGNEGEVVAAFQYERVHEPAEGGASSYRKSVPLSGELLDGVRWMCRELRWTGPAMFEFKVDRRSRTPVFMEVNGRFWGSLALAIHAGVDFPKLLYDMLVTGKCEPVFEYRTSIFVRHTRRDISWLLGNIRTPSGRPDLLKVGAAQLIKEIANILLLRERYDIESLTDPAPALTAWASVLGGCVEKVSRTIRTRRLQRRAHRIARHIRAGDREAVVRIRSVKSILFVCMGNINRSAVAEQRLRTLVAPVDANLRVASAGFHSVPGRQPTSLAIDVAAELGVELSKHRSRVITREMIAGFELVVAMESAHLERVVELDESYSDKTVLLSAFDCEIAHSDIRDPHGAGRDILRETFQRVIRCADGLAEAWHGEGCAVESCAAPVAVAGE